MRRALVTGASRGIGGAVTMMLMDEGWDVVGVSRTEMYAVSNRSGKQRISSWLPLDISDPKDPQWQFFLEQGSIDALIHCAGIRGPFGDFLDNDANAWEQTIATNLIGTANVVRAVLPALQRSDDGRILLFSGGGAFSPEPGFSAYAATKGATIALMETLSEELSATSVTVNAVAPGFVKTTIHAGTPNEHRPEAPDAMANVVACVRHLLGPQTQGLTGRTISAQWDDWASIDQTTIDSVMSSTMGMRDRHKVQCVRSSNRIRKFAAV